GNATVIYTVKASNSSSGAYGIVETRVCGSYPLIVSNNASRWSFADFPGLLDTLTTPIGLCPPWHLFYGKIVGFGGLNMVYLRYKMKFDIPFHETSRSIQSVVVSPTEQNITIKLVIESYAIPVRVGQPSLGSLNDWY